MSVPKVIIRHDDKPTGFEKVAWLGINVDTPAEYNELLTQVPDGWMNVSMPAGMLPTVITGDDYQSENVYTIPVNPTPLPPPEIIVGTFADGTGGGRAGVCPMNE